MPNDGSGDRMAEGAETEALCRLLRAELTAVNQQFTHVLALRRWKRPEISDRITAIDAVDFETAMRIMAHLVAQDAEIRMAPALFEPGASAHAMLTAERRIETRMAEALATARAVVGPTAAALVDAASAPRADYVAWLDAQLSALSPEETPANPGVAAVGAVYAHLLAIVEQSLAHAYVHQRWGAALNADGAWAASGLAMIQGARLVSVLAAEQVIARPTAALALRIARRPHAAMAHDAALATATSTAAEAARAAIAQLPEGAPAAQLGAIVDAVAEIWRRAADWSLGAPHPALETVPEMFRDFAATHRKFSA